MPVTEERQEAGGGSHHLHDEVSTHATLVSRLLEPGVLARDTGSRRLRDKGARCPAGTCLLASGLRGNQEGPCPAPPRYQPGHSFDSPGSPPGSTLSRPHCRTPSHEAVSLQGRGSRKGSLGRWKLGVGSLLPFLSTLLQQTRSGLPTNFKFSL